MPVHETVKEQHTLTGQQQIKLPTFKQLRTQVAASTAGMLVTSLSLSPLSVVKVRVQADSLSSAGSQSSLVQVTKDIYRTGGLRAFWRGTGTGLVMAVPSSALYMTCYEASRDVISESFSDQYKFYAPMAAGFWSRVVTGTLTNPLEVVRMRQQAGSTNFGILSSLRHIVQTTGGRGLYQGLVPSLIRDAPFSAIYWGWLEHCKTSIISANPGAPFTTIDYASGSKDVVNGKEVAGEGTVQLGVLGMFVAAGSAGVVSAIVTHPFDIIKTRAQVSEVGGESAWGAALKAVRREGPLVLYRGLGLRLLTILPGSGIMMTTYDLVKRLDM